MDLKSSVLADSKNVAFVASTVTANSAFTQHFGVSVPS